MDINWLWSWKLKVTTSPIILSKECWNSAIYHALSELTKKCLLQCVNEVQISWLTRLCRFTMKIMFSLLYTFCLHFYLINIHIFYYLNSQLSGLITKVPTSSDDRGSTVSVLFYWQALIMKKLKARILNNGGLLVLHYKTVQILDLNWNYADDSMLLPLLIRFSIFYTPVL